ncbi:uncharacterized protein [Procambarus clarkii]|uniref:uncharacterized protein n=1 Tax=Procambarus clarkii TaxID=6728 RepID=UPI003742E13C
MEDEAVSSVSYSSTETNVQLVSPRKNDDILSLPPRGQKCLKDFWNSLPLDGVYCNATWDSLYCWPATRAGMSVNESCATVFSDVPTSFTIPMRWLTVNATPPGLGFGETGPITPSASASLINRTAPSGW